MSKHIQDPKRMIDVIFVKRLERRLGRPLSEMELEDNEEAVHYCFPDGHIETIKIPWLRFPHDVISGLGELPNKLTEEETKKSYERFYEEEAALQSANSDTRNAA